MKRSLPSRKEDISGDVNGEWVEQNGVLREVHTVWWSWVITGVVMMVREEAGEVADVHVIMDTLCIKV